MTINQWYESVRTVDQRIDSFKAEIETLKNTYNSLYKSLREPSMAEAARVIDKDLGGDLWQQMGNTLRDCLNTMEEVNTILDRINGPRRLLPRPVVKQYRESLQTGPLLRLRERILIFSSGLQLPMQMLQLTVTLSQRQISADNQIQLNDRITRLSNSIDEVLNRVRRSPRADTIEGLTSTRRTTPDNAWLRNMESYMGTAKKFLDRSSAAASTITTSVVQRDDDSSAAPSTSARRASDFTPLTRTKLKAIDSFLEGVSEDQLASVPSESHISITTGLTPPRVGESDDRDNDDSQTDLVLTKALLRNGLRDADMGDHASAERHYQSALAKAQKHDFGGKIAHDSADITLMLSDCYIKQEKYDDAIRLLEPLSLVASDGGEVTSSDSVSVRSSSNNVADRGQALSASHMLAQIYLHKSDLERAETFSLQTFKGRRRFLGQQHPKFRDSVNLVISVYLAKGSKEEAEAYQDFLVDSSGTSTPDVSPKLQPQTPPTPASSPATQEVPPLDPGPTGHGTCDVGPESLQMRESSGTWLSDLNPQPSRQSTNTSDTSRSKFQGMTLEDKFIVIRDLCTKKKHGKAADLGVALLKEYDSEQRLLLTRKDDIRDNIRTKSNNKGLASTGQGFSALHFFCSLKSEATQEVTILLKHGVDVNAVACKAGYRDRDPVTPIDLAVQLGHENIVRLLLEHNAQCRDVKARPGSKLAGSCEPLHPLLVAVQSGHVGIVKLLLKHHNVLVEDDFPSFVWHGNSLLHEASFRCDLTMVQYLVTMERDGDLRAKRSYSFLGHPGQQDAFGITPIMFAVDLRDSSDQKLVEHKRRHRVQCLKMLLEWAGSGNPGSSATRGLKEIADDLFVQDQRGNNVWWYANEFRGGDPALRQYLDQISSRSRLIDM